MRESRKAVSLSDGAKTHRSPVWRGMFWEARTRILIWYIVLMLLFVGVSIPLIRKVLFARVNARVREDLSEEMEKFHEFAKANPQKDIATLFRTFLYRSLPEDDQFLIALLDGEFYQSSPRALPKLLQADSKLVKRWEKLTRSEVGEEIVSDPAIGSILYFAEPVEIEGKRRGAFVVAHTTAGEREEVLVAVLVVAEVTGLVLLPAFVLAWIVSGRVLKPLRLVTHTARSISESDLSKRITVQGSGEIAELTATFNDMMDRLQAAFTTQQNFINDAAHELRTPITIIRGHLELLVDAPEEQDEILEIVIDELDRMTRFVNDLILLAKAERPNFLTPDLAEMETLTEELYVKASVLANREWQLESKGSGQIFVDRQRLTQAVMNLAENATQHTTEGDVIALGSTLTDGNAQFWVRDTGEGIAPANQAQIFERFARVPHRRRPSEGAGLGLSIVRAIALAHGGRVELKSQLGVGSTFKIIIPQ